MATVEKAYEDIVDLFARGTSPEAILKFRPSEAAQQRALGLLERNRKGELTEPEVNELERLGHIEHFMQLVKARAHLYVENRS